MGIHDREYWQDDAPAGLRITGGPRMILTNLIIITVAIALIDVFTTGSCWLSNLLALKSDLYRRPWELWNLLSYGFAHAPIAIKDGGGIWHVGTNMFMLWMFGRVIEMRLGRAEFLWFYLAAIVFSGLVWLGLHNAWLLRRPVVPRRRRPPRRWSAHRELSRPSSFCSCCTTRAKRSISGDCLPSQPGSWGRW